MLQTAESLPWYSFLGRARLPAAAPSACEAFAGKSILVTGAGGSIGTALTLRLAALMPRKLVLLEASENNLNWVEASLRAETLDSVCASYLGSVTDENLLEKIYVHHRPTWVFHAAAHKHVALLEDHPLSALHNNAIGTLLVSRQSHISGARVILVSTDKAAAPVSIMGATKRLAESIVCAHGGTAVRLGNVLGSRGSAVETFVRQCLGGQPLTITHPEARRYWITLEESVELLLSAALESQATSGSGNRGPLLLAADLDRTHCIQNLAEFIASQLSPHRSLSCTNTGLRPGEKMTEQLWASDEKAARTGRNGLRIIETPLMSLPQLETGLKQLELAISNRDVASAIAILQTLVDYTPSERIRAAVPASALQAQT